MPRYFHGGRSGKNFRAKNRWLAPVSGQNRWLAPVSATPVSAHHVESDTLDQHHSTLPNFSLTDLAEGTKGSGLFD